MKEARSAARSRSAASLPSLSLLVAMKMNGADMSDPLVAVALPTRRRFADRGLCGGDDGDAHAAAVDVDDGAVDELRFVGGEVYRCVCDRVRGAERPVRGAVHHCGGGIVLDRGPHDTGGDRVDAHARRPELRGPGPG